MHKRSRLYGTFAQRVQENRQSYRPIVQRHSGRAACCVVRLPVLADTLGIDLELEAEEKAVGPFRADIVARRPDCAAAMRAAGREAGTPPRRRRSSSGRPGPPALEKPGSPKCPGNVDRHPDLRSSNPSRPNGTIADESAGAGASLHRSFRRVTAVRSAIAVGCICGPGTPRVGSAA